MASHERYKILQRLDAGGMAEVFKAMAVSMEGFEKQVAIKKVLPGLSDDDRFLRMFLDEARLSLYLNHANIVQVFDIGKGSDDAYFIVMQFVDGANLKKIVSTLAERGSRMPIEIAVFVAMEMCKGLSYAHNKRGSDGKPLGIVHRDISPPNVLISREGEVKIMDFGLAQSSENLEKTDPGVVKGKFGYLSPEAAHGEEVNPQTDIFAVGIVLWEMLSGKRLFQGDSDYETLQMVRKAEIPSLRSFNQEVPTELETIVRKSLAREQKDRYTGCQEMGSALTQFLFSRGLSVTSYDLSALVKRVVGAERPPSRDGEPSAIDTMIQEEINKFISFESLGEDEESAEVDFGGGGFGGGGLGGGGLGVEDMWGGVFDEVNPDVSVDHIPSGGTKRLEKLSREEASAMAADKATPAKPKPAERAPKSSANPSANPSARPSAPAEHSRSGPDRVSSTPLASSEAEGSGSSKGLWVVFGVLLLLVLAGVVFIFMKLL